MQEGNSLAQTPNGTLTGTESGDMGIAAGYISSVSFTGVQTGEVAWTDSISTTNSNGRGASYKASVGSTVAMGFNFSGTRQWTWIGQIINQAAAGGGSIVPILMQRRMQGASLSEFFAAGVIGAFADVCKSKTRISRRRFGQWLSTLGLWR